MRKVYIDCGAWKGASINFFRKMVPRALKYETYAFECKKDFVTVLNNCNQVKVIPKAVWVYDGMLDFYLGEDESTPSSSVIREKRTGQLDIDHPQQVECIDFSQWILNNFSPEDYVIVKMNIEGAEYNVLDKMIRDDSIKCVSKLFVSFHWNKIGMDEKEHKKLVEKLHNKVPTYHWGKMKNKEFKKYFLECMLR